MITFRAPDDIGQALTMAAAVTGKSKTELLLTLLRDYLPAVALRYADTHAATIAEARAQWLRELPPPYTVTPAPKPTKPKK